MEVLKAAKFSFQNGVNSTLVTALLDHIVVQKGSTKEKIYLDIYSKFGNLRAIFPISAFL